MRKNLLRGLIVIAALAAFQQFRSQTVATVDNYEANFQKTQKVLYFNPEVYPALSEIIEPTNAAFFSAVSDRFSLSSSKMIRAENTLAYDQVEADAIIDFCRNNGANYAVVPKVKYFKVGLGQYVFSNQVEVSMKLYDAGGKLIAESIYNTFKRNMRMLGSAENSVKIGTNGAIRDIMRDLRKLRNQNI